MPANFHSSIRFTTYSLNLPVNGLPSVAEGGFEMGTCAAAASDDRASNGRVARVMVSHAILQSLWLTV